MLKPGYLGAGRRISVSAQPPAGRSAIRLVRHGGSARAIQEVSGGGPAWGSRGGAAHRPVRGRLRDRLAWLARDDEAALDQACDVCLSYTDIDLGIRGRALGLLARVLYPDSPA
jgi:hypothetical protein